MVNIKFRTNLKRMKINKINNVWVVKWIAPEKEKLETRVRISFEFVTFSCSQFHLGKV